MASHNFIQPVNTLSFKITGDVDGYLAFCYIHKYINLLHLPESGFMSESNYLSWVSENVCSSYLDIIVKGS